MAIAIVTQGRSGGSLVSGNAAHTLSPGTLTDGNWVIVVFTFASETYTMDSVPITNDGDANLSWSQVVYSDNHSGGTLRTWIYKGKYVAATHGTVTTVTVDTTGTNQSYGMWVFEVSGADETDPFDTSTPDVTSCNANYVPTNYTYSADAAVTANSDGLALCLYCCKDSVTMYPLAPWALVGGGTSLSGITWGFTQAATASTAYTGTYRLASQRVFFMITLILRDPIVAGQPRLARNIGNLFTPARGRSGTWF